jgi:hypothetical protein
MRLLDVRQLSNLGGHVGVDGIGGILIVVVSCPEGLEAVELVGGLEVTYITL